MRRGRQEELVLEVRGQRANGLGAKRVGGVLPGPPGRSCAPRRRSARRSGGDRSTRPRRAGPPQEPQRSLPLEEVDRGDQPGEVRPRVDVDAPAPPQVPHQFAVDDAEVEAELVPHLVPPLDLERGRADDQNRPGTVPDDEFQADEARLDRLAEAHVVGDQQVDPWHLDGPDHRVKLVVLDVDAGAERRLDVRRRAVADGTPADGIEEGVEPVGRVEAGRLGQGDLLDAPAPPARSPR